LISSFTYVQVLLGTAADFTEDVLRGAVGDAKAKYGRISASAEADQKYITEMF
jgi:hypothetical protein